LQDAVFPLYDQVKPEHVVPGMRALLGQLHTDIDALEASVTPSWEALVEPLEKLTDKHQRTWGVVSHLKVGSAAASKSGRGCGFAGSQGSADRAAVAAGSSYAAALGRVCAGWLDVVLFVPPGWPGGAAGETD
jgi:hypothetical protein